MKKRLLLVLFFLLFNVAFLFAQGPPCPACPPPSSSPIVLSFNYDQAGNQIKRYSPYAKSAVEKEVVAENTIEDDEKLTTTSLLEYFPNPVENELTLSWVRSLNAQVESIQIYSLDSKVIKEFSVTKNSQEHRMPLGLLASGIYVVKVSFDNGKQDTFKIIKK